MKSLADYKKIESVHIPKFDAAIPNMEWKLVERKLTEILVSHGITVYVYEFGGKSPVKTITNESTKKVTGVSHIDCTTRTYATQIKRALEGEDHSEEPLQKKAKISTPQSKSSSNKKALFAHVHVMFYGSCDNDKDLLNGAILA